MAPVHSKNKKRPADNKTTVPRAHPKIAKNRVIALKFLDYDNREITLYAGRHDRMEAVFLNYAIFSRLPAADLEFFRDAVCKDPIDVNDTPDGLGLAENHVIFVEHAIIDYPLSGQPTLNKSPCAIVIRNEEGEEKCFKAKRWTEIGKVLDCYCQKYRLAFGELNFSYKGAPFDTIETPETLLMKDLDYIDVEFKRAKKPKTPHKPTPLRLSKFV